MLQPQTQQLVNCNWNVNEYVAYEMSMKIYRERLNKYLITKKLNTRNHTKNISKQKPKEKEITEEVTA